MMNSLASRNGLLRCILLLAVMTTLAACKSGNQPEAVAAAAATSDPVTAANQAPEIVGIPAAAIESGQTYTFVPAASDADQDFLEFQITNKPNWAQFSTETGSLTGTPQDEDVGETDDITIAVTDGRDQRAVGPFKIRIGHRGGTDTAGNTPPVISGSPGTSVQVDRAYSFTPTATDANGDKLTFIVSNRPSWAAFNSTTGTLTGTPVAANEGAYANIVISVSDGKTTTSLPAFTVQVNNGSNHAPAIVGSPITSVQVAQAYSFAPVATDADSDSLSFTIQNKPSWATFSAANGRLSGTPAAGNVGSYANIVISVGDGKATTSLTPFNINVIAPTNRTPTISGSASTTATVGSAYSFKPTASDPDGDALGYTIQNRPTWAAFSTTTGALTGTPSSAGTKSNIIISVSDGKVTASLPAFAIAVTAPANGAPTVSGTPATTVVAGSSYSFRPSASDPNGDTLSWSITNKPAWATFSTTTGKLSGAPTTGNVGSYTNIRIAVTDGKSTTSLSAFSIAVTQNASGSASLSWQAPTQNTDGTPLGDLAGFRIIYGMSAGALSQTVDVANAAANTYTVNSLSSGTWYFAIKAYTASGTESALSAVASKSIP